MTDSETTDPRAGLAPHIRALLEKADRILASIPPEHQERIVRKLLADIERQIAQLQGKAG